MGIFSLTGSTVALLLFCFNGNALLSSRAPRHGGFKLSSTTENHHNDIIEEFISSNELQNVFTLLLRNPTVSPSIEQSTLLLNNLNILAKMSGGNDISKFYQRLQKAGKAIPSFGAMVLDGPLNEVNLPDFELLMNNKPDPLRQAMEITEASYQSLLIPNELGTMSSASRSSLEIRLKLQIILLFVFVDFGAQLVATGDSQMAMTQVAWTMALSAGLFIADSRLCFNGEIARRIGWLKSAVLMRIDGDEKKKEYRANAATFLVAYLLGSPIQNFDLDGASQEAQKRFRYPEAPRISLRDSAMDVLDLSGKIDLQGLKRQATIQMTASAVAAIDGTSTPQITNYAKILLATLGHSSANPSTSTIPQDEFPNRLLPTLARWGFVEAGMIIRENAACIDAIVEVFESGGGVGDAILVIEQMVTSNPASPLMIRKAARQKVEAEALEKDYSTYKALAALNVAKVVATPTPATAAIDLEEIEHIPGTTRTYTRAELILPPNPSPSQVKILAREVMSHMILADRMSNGKVSEKTKKEIAALFEQVSTALKIYELTEEAAMGAEKDFESAVSLKNGEDQLPETLRDGRSFIRNLMVEEEREGLLGPIGLSKQKLSYLKTLPAVMRDLDIIGETLIQLNKLKDSYWNNYYNVEALWVFRGSVYFQRLTGLVYMNALDGVWDATGMNSRIPKGVDKADKLNTSLGGGKLNRETVKELSELVERISPDIQPPPVAMVRPNGEKGAVAMTMTVEQKGEAQGLVQSSIEQSGSMEAIKGIKMIPISGDNVSLLSKDTVNRSQEQKRKALAAGKGLPLLTDLLSKKEDDVGEDKVQESSPADATEGAVSPPEMISVVETHSAPTTVTATADTEEGGAVHHSNAITLESNTIVAAHVEHEAQTGADQQIESGIEHENEVEVIPSVPLMMIKSHVGLTYSSLLQNSKELDIKNITKTKRIKELEAKLRM